MAEHTPNEHAHIHWNDTLVARCNDTFYAMKLYLRGAAIADLNVDAGVKAEIQALEADPSASIRDILEAVLPESAEGQRRAQVANLDHIERRIEGANNLIEFSTRVERNGL